jgi:iron(III) transport system substrate-binding protein
MGPRLISLVSLAALAAAFVSSSAVGQSLPAPFVESETIGSPDLVAAACAEGQIVYYTAQSDSNERAIIQPFQKQFPCVAVSVISAVTGRLYERIQTEIRAGKIQNDVVMITDEALAQRLIDGKLVRPWTPPSATVYPDHAKVAGWWYAGSGSAMYPVYNTQLVAAADAPRNWRDLLDPRWKGKLGTTPITTGGNAWMTYAFLRAKFGADYLAKFVAQEPRVMTSASQVVISVERGELSVGVVGLLDEYSHRMTDGAPIQPIYPPEGVPYTNYPMMIMADAPHPHAAELFANWYLSKAGQASLVQVRGAYSVRADVAPAKGNPPLAQLRPWNPGLDAILRDHDALVTEVTAIFGGR